MIALARGAMLRRRRRQALRLPSPSRFVLVSGCTGEKIDAIVDEHNRVTQLVVHTRSTVTWPNEGDQGPPPGRA